MVTARVLGPTNVPERKHFVCTNVANTQVAYDLSAGYILSLPIRTMLQLYVAMCCCKSIIYYACIAMTG